MRCQVPSVWFVFISTSEERFYHPLTEAKWCDGFRSAFSQICVPQQLRYTASKSPRAGNIRLWCSKWFFGLIWQLLFLLCQASLTFFAILFLQENPFPAVPPPSLFVSQKRLLLVGVVLQIILVLKLLLPFHRNGVSGGKGRPRCRRERRLGKDSLFADGECYSCTQWHTVLDSQ